MALIEKLRSSIQEKLNNRFVQNFGWMAASDLFVRVSYLATVVVTARIFTIYDYGLIGIIVPIHELMLVFSRLGIGVKVIQADAADENFDALCNSAYWLNWLVFLLLFIAQCLVSFGVARFYEDHRLIAPICIMALSYLMIPISSIQASLILKENQHKIPAITSTIQFTFTNLLTIILVFCRFGIWAFILPRVLSTPIWVYMHYINHSWRPSQGVTTKYWGEILSFGKSLLGVQLLKTLRLYLDNLLVGKFLGVGELGMYSFAFNAGFGISMSILSALSSSLFPHLCDVRSDPAKLRKQYFSSLKIIALVIIPVVVLQACLAPFYVPLIFGSKWTVAIPILILICLSAIPRPFAEAAGQLSTAVGRPDIDLRSSLIFTGLFAIAIWIGVRWDILGVAIAVLVVHWIFMPIYALWASRYVFTKLQPLPKPLEGSI